MWKDVDAYLEGTQSIEDFLKDTKPDHATDVINTMIVEDGRTYFINRANSHCVENDGRPVGNLPEDAFLELECQVDARGPRPFAVGDFPLGLHSLQTLILDIHELTVEAIVKRDRDLLVRALAMDPLVNSIATAKAVIDDLFAAEREALPDWGVRRSATASFNGNGAAKAVSAMPQLY